MPNTLAGNTRPGNHSNLKAVIRWSLRIFLVVAGIALLLLATFVAINLKDVALTPESKALLQDQQFHLPDEQNSFYILELIS